MSELPPVTLAPAQHRQADQIARVWHDAWMDGHLGNVPPGLVEHRSLVEFERRAAARLGTTTVALACDDVIGFVTVIDDEIEQLFVDARWRGTGLAERLLTEGEHQISLEHEAAWLAVVAGNVRARRFYERCGWEDGGPFDTIAEISGGHTMPVPAHRYIKRFTSR